MKETKVDLHVHSIVSKCSLNPIYLLKKVCKKKNIIPAVCDHNKLTKLDFAIPGEEIATKTGEFIGLFLTEEIPPNLDIYEALDRVSEQGGLIYLPHPFDLNRRRSLAKFGILEDKEFLKQVDIVEVFNSRCRSITPNLKALEYAEKYGFAMGFGSDAHFIWEVENAYVIFDELDFEKPTDLSPKEFLRFLKIKSDELIKLKFSLLQNPWRTKYHYGSLGSKYNITLYSKILKKIRRKLNI
ncbi:MAG: PHP domain-containing protein [Methanococci archaeon]|nr:PHP domain-containing protein [Methanococci archaeon]